MSTPDAPRFWPGDIGDAGPIWCALAAGGITSLTEALGIPAVASPTRCHHPHLARPGQASDKPVIFTQTAALEHANRAKPRIDRREALPRQGHTGPGGARCFDDPGPRGARRNISGPGRMRMGHRSARGHNRGRPRARGCHGWGIFLLVDDDVCQNSGGNKPEQDFADLILVYVVGPSGRG